MGFLLEISFRNSLRLIFHSPTTTHDRLIWVAYELDCSMELGLDRIVAPTAALQRTVLTRTFRLGSVDISP
jgi:hypothetical protein